MTDAVEGARSAEETTADTSYLSTSIPDALWLSWKHSYMIMKDL